MNIEQVLLWGLAATVLLTIILSVSKPLGLTRMDLPFLLGTMLTSNRNRAPLYGFVMHIVIGWLFAFLYAALLQSSGVHNWWLGALAGGVHALFVLTIGLQIVNGFHPRMAKPYQGPTPTKQLQPPGFFALNYGKGTPVSTIIAHIVYGSVLGWFFT